MSEPSGEERVSVYSDMSSECTVECPMCKGSAYLREALYEVPGVGRVLLTSLVCPRCGFRKSDMIPLQVRRRRRIYYRVESAEDLNARVVRSSVASVEIPELGISITPGAAGQFTVTNVEGILHLVKDAAKSAEVLEGERFGFAERVERLIREGGRFTVIIDDPWGISTIEPPEGSGSCKLIVEEVEGASEKS